MVVFAAAVGEAAAPNVEGQTDGIVIVANGYGVGADQVGNFKARGEKALKRRIDGIVSNECARS